MQLLSLKAELLRKQNEVSKAKSKQAAQPFIPKSFEKLNPKPKPVSRHEAAASRRAETELEENEQLERSKRILEAKSKFYDRMTATGGSLNSDDNCLVMFNVKKQTEKVQSSSSSSEESDTDEAAEVSKEFTEDWVEYVDSLGRTRRCLKSDLEFFKKRDEALSRDLGVDSEKATQDDHTESVKPDSSSESESEDELLKTGRQVQAIREQWEKQEAENKDKEFMHYQDVLFNGIYD